QFYAYHPGQNSQDGNVNVDGRLDVAAESYFYGTAQAAHQHIPFGSPNSPGDIAQPVTYNDYRAGIANAQEGRRFPVGADLAVDSTQYNAAPLVGGGILPQSWQNTIISQTALRAGYELIPDYLGYIRTAGSLYDYWRMTSFNSTVYRVDLGLR